MARAPPTHPQLEPLTLGPSFGNSEAPAGSFEPSLRYQMIPKGSNFQDSCSTSPRHLVVGNVEKCWNPGKGGKGGARLPLPTQEPREGSLRRLASCVVGRGRAPLLPLTRLPTRLNGRIWSREGWRGARALTPPQPLDDMRWLRGVG